MTSAQRHIESGALIVYTSQDSVLQIAAHEAVVPVDELHTICRRLRAELPGEYSVGRVIARPFTGEPGGFRRIRGRLDLSLHPPTRSYLEELRDAGVAVHTVGKAGQLFAGVGVDVEHPGATNAEALTETEALLDGLEAGLVFTNLVETDQVYGHRHDAPGFHRALQAIDAAVAGWLPRLRDDDLLVLTADHGCDVTAPHTDHTREHAPLLRELRRPRWAPARRPPGRCRRQRADVAHRTRGSATGHAVHRGPRCLSCPRSRRSAASSRPTSRGARSSAPRSSTPAGPGPRIRGGLPATLAGRAVEEVSPRGQVPDLGALRGPLPAHPPADDRLAAVRPCRRVRRTPGPGLA